MDDIVGFDIESDVLIGAEGGFLALRRVGLRNRRADGTRSAPYVCDFVVRARGADAVVVALYHRDAASGRVRVLLRDGLRPALGLGRDAATIPVPDRRRYRFFSEVVAGIVERGDGGEDGLKRRAAAEVEEEAGYEVAAEAVELLGAGIFPSPGSMPEKFWLAAVEIADPAAQRPPPGDGSPMEEGARTRWLELDDAIAACTRGDIEDGKTELILRRLRDRLAGGAAPAR